MGSVQVHGPEQDHFVLDLGHFAMFQRESACGLDIPQASFVQHVEVLSLEQGQDLPTRFLDGTCEFLCDVFEVQQIRSQFAVERTEEFGQVHPYAELFLGRDLKKQRLELGRRSGPKDLDPSHDLGQLGGKGELGLVEFFGEFPEGQEPRWSEDQPLLGCVLGHEDLESSASHRAWQHHEHTVHIPNIRIPVAFEQIIDRRMEDRLAPA